LVEEKLVNDDIIAILEQLCAVEFGEHSILIYQELDSFREVYSKYVKKMLDANNIVLVLPHYENVECVKQVLKEIEVDVQKHQSEGSLVIMDSVKGLFGPSVDNFISFLKILQQRVETMGKGGLAAVVDMGAFYHLRKIGEMITYEKSIPAKSDTKSSLLCSYHAKDFDRLSGEQKQTLLDHHYRNLLVKDPEQS
jgi:hypothetical protein